MLPIEYRGFYDVPRMILVRHPSDLILLDCPFDDIRDDYPDAYTVYRMPDLAEGDLSAPWLGLAARSLERLGTIPVSEIRFDETRRKSIDPTPLDQLLAINRRIEELHGQGVPILAAIKRVREEFDVGLGPAKIYVTGHSSYAAVAEAMRPLHEEAIQALMSDGESTPEDGLPAGAED